MEQKLANVLIRASTAWRDVLAIYGGTMCSAQILERELVQVLAFLRTKTGELKSGDFDWAYREMVRMKPGDILTLFQGSGGNLSPESQESVRKALRARNFLAHEFFHKFSPVMTAPQSKRIAIRLQKIDSDLTSAFELLQPLRLKLEAQLGLSEQRQSVSKDFREKIIQAIVSFNDE